MNKDPVRHTLLGVGLRQWYLMNMHNGGVSSAHIGMGAYLTYRSIINTLEAWLEDKKFGAAIDNYQIDKPPIFVVGHWRSGTTHLENVLCQDPQFGYLSTIQSLYPNTFLTREAHYTSRFHETKRYMDNVDLKAHSPSEEEVAMAVLSPGSFWHGYYFPSHMDEYFEKYVLFNSDDERAQVEWTECYRYLLKKLSLYHRGKRLLLKNPPNTSRLTCLHNAFPDARFIHIHRNPYEVFVSRMKQYELAVLKKALQPISKAEWESRVLDYYARMLDKHIEQRKHISADQYIEVAFDDLKRDPLSLMANIYTRLELEGFDAAKPQFLQYIDSLGEFQQNTYKISPEIINKVNTSWGKYFDIFGYEMQTP